MTTPTPVHQRRLKVIQLTIGTVSVDCQLRSWNLDPGVQDGDRIFTYCSDPSGENSFVEETDDQPTLEIQFLSDWREDGLSTFLWNNPNVAADFVLDHHPDIAEEHVRWTGKLLIKPPPAGGDVRTTEVQDITFQLFGTVGDGLDFTRPSSS